MHITPEHGVPLGGVAMADIPLPERAKLACNTIKALFPDEDDDPEGNNFAFASEPEKELARDLFTTVTAKPAPVMDISTIANYPTASLMHLDRMLSEYDHELINSAVRIREYVKNKLIVDSDNPDGRIRIRALELLGKMRDVGLFAERMEITHKTKTDAELEDELGRKLERYMGLAERVIDVEDDPDTPPPLDDLLSRLAG